MTIKELIVKYKDEIENVLLLLSNNQAITQAEMAVAIDKAYTSILNYTGWTIFNSDYQTAVYALSVTYLNNDKVKYKTATGVRLTTQKSEGSRSVTYSNNIVNLDTFGLTEDVKAMLPLPKLRCF